MVEPSSRSSAKLRRRSSEASKDHYSHTSVQRNPLHDIIIDVNKLENVDQEKIKEVSVKMYFMGKLLAESLKVGVLEDNTADVKATGTILMEEPTAQFVDDLLANPVVFTVIDESSLPKAPTSVKGSKPSASMKSSAHEVIKYVILGLCNMNLYPLVTAEKKTIRESLIVEQEKKAIAQEIVSWPKLPRLLVTVSTGEKNVLEETNSQNNIIGVTVESVYNISSSIPDGTSFDAIFPVPRYGDKTDKIVFENGTKTTQKDCECTKRWATLSTIEGRGGLTTFKITHDPCDITMTVNEDIDMEKMFHDCVSRIHWNQWRNTVMVKTGSNYFFEKIIKHRVWPIEVVTSSKSAAGSAAKSAKSAKAGSTNTGPTEHYTAFLNLNSLLYPGVTKVRVASQLYTYAAIDLVNKWGAEFKAPASPRPSQGGKGTKSATAKSAEPEILLEKESPGTPLYNEQGLPVFIVVEIELWKPYAIKRSPEYLQEKLVAYLPLKGNTSKRAMCMALAEENFKKSVETLSDIIRQEYQKYMLANPTDKFSKPSEETFYKHLCQVGDFQNIKVSLQNKVTDLIGEKYGSTADYEEVMPEIYTNLVEEMHKIVNNCVNEWGEFSKSFQVEADQLQLFAEEAIEEEEYELARRYLLEKILRCKMNPDYWLDYAVFCLGIEENDKAVELVKEALSWDFGHQIGLLLYGLVLTKINDYTNAEMAFQLLLYKYPKFTEGWTILHLFYIKTENSEGAEVALEGAVKARYWTNATTGDSCECDTSSYREKIESTDLEEAYQMIPDGKCGMASYIKGGSSADPLGWTTKLCPKKSLYVQAGVLLMKLRYYELAETALGQELLLENRGRTVPYLYYLSVSHYLRGRYREAISHLEEAVRSFGKDYSLWSLMGHCYHKLRDFQHAVGCYEYVIESFNRPDDIHLIYLRMSDYCIKTKKFKCAKKLSTCASKYTPSPKTWLNVGISCYNLSQFAEAEEAFTESNFLDNRLPITWGYLALINIHLQRNDVVQNCYNEAVKNNLNDESLLQQISILSDLNRLNIKR